MKTEKNMSLYRERCSPNYRGKILDASHRLWHSPSLSARSLWLRCAFRSIRCGGWWLERAGFPYFLAELVLEGELTYRVDGRIHTAGPGMIHLTPVGAETRVEHRGEGRCSRIGLELCGTALSPLLDAFELTDPRSFHPSNPARYHEIWRRIYDLLEKRNPGSEPEISALCYEVLSGLADELLPGGCAGFPKRLSDILNFIHSEPGLALNCSTLAERANCSLPTLNRLFLRHLGKTPQRYIHEYRMSCAKDFLLIGDRSVKEISSRLGYRNAFYFSRVFKAEFGCSPSRFTAEKHSVYP